MRFQDKTIVITGGASGIGRGTVDLFLQEGAQVIVGDIDDEEGLKMQAALGDNFLFNRCDVTQEQDIKSLMDLAVSHTGGLDYVFNNAGAGGSRATIEDVTGDEWDFAMALLLKSVAMGIKYAVPHLKARGGGAIVNTSSVAAQQAGYGPVAYSAAKAGVLHLNKVAAAQLAQHNIRVNAICPGFIHTNIFGSTLTQDPDEKKQIFALMGQMGAGTQPVPRPGQPTDIAEAVAYLCSDAASFMTGTDMLVDGGLLVGPKQAWDTETPGMLDAIQPEEKM